MIQKASTHKTSATIFIVVLAFLALIFSYKFPLSNSHAKSSSIIINEVMYDPEGADQGFEWIELMNISDNPINLEGWHIQAGGNIFTDRATLESFTVDPQDIVLIAESEVPDADIYVSNLSLQNGGSETDGVRIMNSDSEVIDTLLYDSPNENQLPDDTGETGSSFANDTATGNALARISKEDTDFAGQDFIETPYSTPGSKNLIAPLPEITISEPRYINESITIDGSDSQDTDGDIVTYEWTICRNENDIFTGSMPSFNYTFDTEGNFDIKLTITDNDNLQSSILTEIEVTQNPENPQITKINEIPDFEDGQRITIEGVITAPIPCLYEKESYVQDDTGGTRIKVSSDFQINFQEVYRISGKLDTAYGERRVIIDSAEPVQNEFSAEPELIPPSKISPDILGKLITTEGKITRSQGNYLYLETSDEDNPIKIYFSKYSELEKPQDVKGKYLKVTGIVSGYGTTAEGATKIRVMPRFDDDISINSKPQLLSLTGSRIIGLAIKGFLITIFTLKKTRY